jgi:hypothetical protein
VPFPQLVPRFEGSPIDSQCARGPRHPRFCQARPHRLTRLAAVISATGGRRVSGLSAESALSE